MVTLLKGFRAQTSISMKNLPIIASLLLGITFTSCDENQERIEQEIVVPVTVTALQPGPIEKYITITGTVKPLKEVELKTLVEGHYKLLNNQSTNQPYALGDYVKADQKIIQIENREYENSVKLSSLKLNLETSGQTFDKQQSLYEKGGVTLSELKQAEINYMNAKYSYEDALIKLGKMPLKAPFSGVIVDLPYFTPNGTVGANTPVATLMDYSRLIMEVSFSESNLHELKKGQQVKIHNYVAAEDTINGVLSQISPAIDPETRSFKGTILLDNPQLVLRPGMFVKAKVITNRADSALIIPREVIQSRGNKHVVFVLEDGFARERNVQFGIEEADHLQIIAGLDFKDRLISKGFETLKDKAKVKIVK